jgi:hypothetical protein
MVVGILAYESYICVIIVEHAKELTIVRWMPPKSGWVTVFQRKG